MDCRRNKTAWLTTKQVATLIITVRENQKTRNHHAHPRHYRLRTHFDITDILGEVVWRSFIHGKRGYFENVSVSDLKKRTTMMWPTHSKAVAIMTVMLITAG